MKIKKILITGSNGFLGQHLFQSLNKEFEVIGLDREEIKKAHNSHVIKEIGKYQEIDLIIMCHASIASGNYSPNKTLLEEVNISYTHEILNLFYGVRIIYVSTTSVFENEKVMTENTNLKPQNQYAQTKRIAEQLVLKNQGNIVVRLTSIFGKNMKENTIIPSFINQAIKENKIKIEGDGTRIQNYLSINEAVSYITAIIKNYEKVKNQTLLLVGSEHISNEKLAKHIASRFEKCQIQKTDVKDSINFIYDNTKTLELLEYKFKFEFFDELNKYIDWKIKNIDSQRVTILKYIEN